MPDPFHLLILIVTFLVSVVLGGLIVGGIVAASLALKPFDSQWVSAFGTVLAALGTVSTLGFLVYQNTIQTKELKDERRKREDHEAKQQELLSFQKYEMHKTAFHSILTRYFPFSSSYSLPFTITSCFPLRLHLLLLFCFL